MNSSVSVRGWVGLGWVWLV